MKKVYSILSATLLSLCSCHAQSSYFTTVSKEKSTVPIYLVAKNSKETADTTSSSPMSAKDSLPLCSFLSSMTIPELEFVIDKYKTNHNRSILSRSNKESGASLHLYNGESHPLTIANVLTVMDEVGITNQLFVLAQSLLETGFYKSHVCNAYHNLFGLYDSRHKQYYHFERWEDSIVGYKNFIQYRYKGGSYLAFLKRIGYAEDPHYIAKVAEMSRKLKSQVATNGVF